MLRFVIENQADMPFWIPSLLRGADSHCMRVRQG